jgi:hypothetical protein
MTKQPWHTEGYDKLARVAMYLGISGKIGDIPRKDAEDALRVVIHAGRQIRKQVERNAARRAKHEAMTSLGLKRVKGALGGTYYE